MNEEKDHRDCTCLNCRWWKATTEHDNFVLEKKYLALKGKEV